jgi:HEPN domain-containing protein
MSGGIDPLERLKVIIKENFPDARMLGDNIDQIMAFIEARKIGWGGDAKPRKLSHDFLNEAERDVRSCRVLYSIKMYPHAVYHFQQAVEKAMKGYCLAVGMLSLEEVRSHDTPYLLLKGLFEKTGMKEMLKNLGPESKSVLDRAWEAQHNREKRLEIARMRFEQIIHELSELDKDKKRIKQLLDSLTSLAATVRPGSPLPLEIMTLPVLASLYRLGAISFPHEAFTRYPDDEEMIPTEYVRELGVVKAIPKMTECLIIALKELRFELGQA